MNAEEFELLGRTMGDPWELAAKIVGPELKLIAVTLGPGGARYIAGAAFKDDPLQWPGNPTSSGDPWPRPQWDGTRRRP